MAYSVLGMLVVLLGPWPLSERGSIPLTEHLGIINEKENDNGEGNKAYDW